MRESVEETLNGLIQSEADHHRRGGHVRAGWPDSLLQGGVPVLLIAVWWPFELPTGR